MMDIYSKPGTRVIYTGKNGYESDIEHSKKYLKIGKVYTIDEIDIQDWRSEVYLVEVPGVSFNSVHFKET